MSHWILPFSSTTYEATDALLELGRLTWRLRYTRSIQRGDELYLYESRPTSAIVARVLVTSVPGTMIEDRGYWKPGAMTADAAVAMHFDVELGEIFAPEVREKLGLRELLTHGMNGAPRSMQLLAPETIDYVSQVVAE